MQLEQDKVVLIAENIAPSIALNLSYGFDDAITEITTNALKNENILLIQIKKSQTQRAYIFSKYAITLEEHEKNSELIQQKQLLDPVTNTEIGTLSIVYSNDSYEENLQNFNLYFLSGILGFTLAIYSLIYLLYRSLKKLSKLDNSLKEFDPKQPKKLPSISSNNDEIYSIVNSANIMIENIIKFINESKKLNDRLLTSQVHLKDAQRMAKVGSVEYDVTLKELLLSDEYYRILGVKPNTISLWEEFLSFIAQEDYHRVKQTIDKAIEVGSQFSITYMLQLSNNRVIYLQTKGKVRKKKGEVVKLTAISMDITAEIKSKETIEKLAYFDALTGLANRTLLKDRMLKALQRSERLGEKLAVLFLDLDHFKLINDTLGHTVGDELLIFISNILKSHTRDSDTISRLGGDEFIILLPQIKHLEDVELFASKIQKALEKKHDIGSHKLYITSSIGVSIYPHHGSDADVLIRNADTAMYEAKNDGRNRYRVYSDSMGSYVDKQLHLEQDLSDAVKNQEEIQVYYQAKIDARSKQIAGAEALVRWHHPINGVVFPDDFIYMAESTGLMIELGNQITLQSIKMIQELNTLNTPPLTIAINLSARQFQDASLVPFIKEMLQKYHISPSQVEFEITESISMLNTTNTLRILSELKDIGVSIAIDDFGTGHSSLAYLKKFPINTLKIDKSFISGIIDDEEDRVITETIITMAHSLGLKTVAEGVETQEHVSMLENLECDTLQGYFYSKPLPRDAFIEFIQEYKTNN